MFQNKTFFAAFALAVLLLGNLQADASKTATQLRINAAGDLEVIDSKGQLVTALGNGSISQSIKADNQAFKVSYGKDLKGRFTTIVYPDPEKPQTVAVSVFKQDVTISSDAVLTVVAEKDMSAATLQSGVVGKVSVAGTALAGGDSVRIQNGALVANVPAPAPAVKTAPVAPATKPVKTAPSVAVTQAPLPAKVEAAPTGESSSPVPAHYDGAHTRQVEGDVMIAPKGEDVVDLVKNSPTPPRLASNGVVSPGSTVQTGPTGKAYVSPFPGAVIMIEPNSTVEFEELSWKKRDGKVQHSMTANVKQGGVISAIQGIKFEELDYKVKTPHGVAAARGTVYITRINPNGTSTTVVVSEGKVQIVTAQGTFTIGVDAGSKITFPIEGPNGPIVLKANGDEIKAAEALLAAVQAYINLNDWGSSLGDDSDVKAVAPSLDTVIQTFQSTFEPRLSKPPMTPTTP